LERQLEVLDQNGEGALRHGSVTDEQDFIFEFQHGKNVLARHFVRIFFALQEFIEKTRTQLHTTTKVGRRCRAAQTSTGTSGAMFWRAQPHGSASFAALAGGEFGATPQVCPTIVGGSVRGVLPK
jgi:hypothetical protein